MATLPFDPAKPATADQALTDVTQINTNFLALRDFESSTTAPTNPVEGCMWWKDNGDTTFSMYTYTGGAWKSTYIWKSTDWPALSSELTSHTGSNITSVVTVHGIKQGSGGLFDADLLDGQEGAYYAVAANLTNHSNATSGTHGITGNFVGTGGVQSLSNKTLVSPVINDFTSAQHTHGDTGNGGTLSASAIVSGTFGLARVSGILGAWDSSKTTGTVYLAATDLFITTRCIGGPGSVSVYTDNSNPPTTLRTQAGQAGNEYTSVSCFVRKNDYYKVVITGAHVISVIPLGS